MSWDISCCHWQKSVHTRCRYQEQQFCTGYQTAHDGQETQTVASG